MQRVPDSPRLSGQLRLAYAGTPEFAVPALRALVAAGHELAVVYAQPDRPAGRGRQLLPGAVKSAALELGLPVEQPDSLRNPEAQAQLASRSVDAMIVAAYGLILPQAILDTPRLGCINIHASLLPRWRGAAPIQRAILAGDDRTGISIMRMEAGLDTGPVYLERATQIGATETAGQLQRRLAELGARCIVEALPAIDAGSAVARAQDAAAATYARKLEKREARIDWTRGAAEIDRAVRAFNPWPVAETSWRAQQLRIWRARPIEQRGDPPGAVLQASSAGIVVACGAGALCIEELQLPGKRPLSAAEFLNAHDPGGVVLGTP